MAVVINVQPQSAAYYRGTSAAKLTVTAASDSGIIRSYQWYKNGSAYQSQQSATVSTSTVGTASYYCVVTDGAGYTATSNTAYITTYATPTPLISAQSMDDQTVYRGGSTSAFSIYVQVTRGTLSYQWQSSSNGSSWSNISGATSRTYTPPSSTVGTKYYRCRATNTLNGYTTTDYGDKGKVTVNATPAPNITQNPASAHYYIGATATNLRCTATSASGSLSYQWMRSENGSTWSVISGATSVNYTPPVNDIGTAYYYCRVTNTLNGYTASASSSSATVTVEDTPAPVITSQPSNRSTYIGNPSAGFSVTATAAAGTLSYQWQRNSGGSWSNISGATGSTYAETDNDTIGSRSYRCAITNTLNGYTEGPVYTSTATLKVSDTPTPAFTSAYNMQGATYQTGDTATALNATASVASGTLTYRWQSSADGSSWNNISGATSATYTPSTAASGTTYYRCVVTNSLYGHTKTKNSATAVIVVSSSSVPVPTFTPEYSMNSASYYRGAPSTALNASATAIFGTITYQWQESADGENWTNVSGAFGATYNPPTGTVGDAYYRCIVLNSNSGDVTALFSNDALITVNATPVPALTAQSSIEDAAYVQGATPIPLNASSSVPAGTVSYQWQRSGDGANWTDISGATQSAYSPQTDAAGTVYYRCVVTNSLYGYTAQMETNAAEITVAVPVAPVITEDPASASYSVADAASPLTVNYTADTPPVEFQWQESDDGAAWSDIDGAADSTYTPSTMTAGTKYYRAILSSGYGQYAQSATSGACAVTVTVAAPVFTRQPVGADYDYKANPQPLTAEAAAPGSTVTYQWQESTDNATFTDIAGATGNSYIPSTAQRSQKYYRCAATAENNGQTATAYSDSAFVRVTGGEAPIFVQALKSGTYRADEGVAALNGTATSPDAVQILYQWYYSQDNETFYPINGATQPTFTPYAGGTQYYYVIATAVFEDESTTSSRSNTAEILILNAKYSFGEGWRQYLNALHGSFVKLVRLEFLQPDGSVAFALDNNPGNRRSGAFIQSGSITVNLQNGVRRTATVTLANLDGEYDYNVNRIWFGQQILLSEGMVLPNGQEFYLPQGVFYIKNPEERVMPNLRTVTYKLEDKWSYLNGDLFGRLDGIYEIDVGTNIFTAIQSILDQDRGNGQKVDGVKPVFTEYYNDRFTQLPDGTYVSDLVTPYTYRNDSDSGSYADIILEMAGVLAAWVGYDAAGRLRIDPSQDDILDTSKPVQWEFRPTNADFLGATYTVKNADVYNDVIITGESLSGYGYISGRAQNLDPRSDTNVNLIGKKTYRESSAGFYTREQCENLAVFRLKRQTVLQKSVSISCQQIFHISENQLVTIERPDKPGSPIERHLVTGFTRPLAQTGPMTINATSVNDFPMATVIWPDNTQGTQTLKVFAAVVGEQYADTATAT